MTTTIVAKFIGAHVCDLPGWRERRRRGINLGDRLRCGECGQEWEWKTMGWYDTWKVWWKVS